MAVRTNRTLTLDEVAARFENWRQNRQGKVSRPDELWSAAVVVARREGMNRTSTRLRVEWNQLKRRMAPAGTVSRQAAHPSEGNHGGGCGEPEPGVVGGGIVIQITPQVASIRRWWEGMGRALYPAASKLLICADGGGSNGSRLRLWKIELQRFAEQTGIAITVCHLPPGTSKWNKIEHRLFSHISMNWRGKPLTRHEVIVDLIGATTTKSGLRVKAELDSATYPTGIKVSDAQMTDLAPFLNRHSFHGEWNYDLSPQPVNM